MDWTAVIAIFAVFTTFLSPVLIFKLTTRNQHSAKLDDRRAVLYTEATIYAQTLDSMLNRITDPYSTFVARPELTHADVITARMRLIAPPEILASWQQIVADEEVLQWNFSEDSAGGGAVPLDYPAAVELRESVKKFYDVSRSASVGK